MCDEKWILYDRRWWPVQWLDWEEAPKHFPKPNLNQKKVMVTVWWFAASLIHYKLSESWQNHYIWKVCSAVDEMDWKVQCLQPALVNRERPMPECTSHANTSEVERIGLQSFASSTIFTWPLPNQLPLLQTTWQLFAGKTPLQPAGGRKCFPRVQWIPKHGFLLYRNKQIYFSLAKNVLTVMVPVLINKDVLKPSYNDLKFTVRKHNYVCTNLIT